MICLQDDDTMSAAFTQLHKPSDHNHTLTEITVNSGDDVTDRIQNTGMTSQIGYKTLQSSRELTVTRK